MSEVRGFGRQKGQTEIYRGAEYTMQYVPKVKLEIAVSASIADAVVEALGNAARTGQYRRRQGVRAAARRARCACAPARWAPTRCDLSPWTSPPTGNNCYSSARAKLRSGIWCAISRKWFFDLLRNFVLVGGLKYFAEKSGSTVLFYLHEFALVVIFLYCLSYADQWYLNLFGFLENKRLAHGLNTHRQFRHRRRAVPGHPLGRVGHRRRDLARADLRTSPALFAPPRPRGANP